MIRRLVGMMSSAGLGERPASAVAILLVVLVAAGCGGRVQSAPGRLFLVLADVSDSTVGSRRQFYTDFEKVLGELRSGDLLLMDRVAENPTSTFPVRVEARGYNALADNKLLFNQRERQERKKVLERVYEFLFEKRREKRGTRILASLRLSDGVFKAYGDRQPILVLFSDMIEQSTDYDFAGQDLSPEGIRQIIARERSSNRLPDLKGVKVYVAGALGTGTLQTDRAFAIRDFWFAYFKACGADLTRDRYGATLLSFNAR